MKQYPLIFVLLTCLAGRAAIIEFDLSPVGTDTAVGLSPMNEVPPAVGSVAGGEKWPGLLFFDTDKSILSITFLYGQWGGYENLSSPLTGVGIYGSAPAGQNATLLFDLFPFHLPMGFPPTTGFVFGTVNYPSTEVDNLLQGQHYVNITSQQYPGGELRAQLIPALPVNGAPTVQCEATAVLDCSEPTAVTVLVADPDGDPLTVVWDWNGTVVQTNQVAAGSGSVSVSFVSEVPLGGGMLTVRASDPGGLDATCSTVIEVVDATPPVIQSVTPDRAVLWPPNHKMVPISLTAVVEDECGTAVWGITSVTSNEPDNGLGDGNSTGDCQILDDHTVLLRAERSGRGDDRIYTLTVEAVDSSENLSAPYYLQVTVPH